MKLLNLDSFISNESDSELNHYKILSGLKEYRNEINKNKLYPSLSELVYLSSQLEDILNKKDNFSLFFHKRKSDKNIKVKSLIVDTADQAVEYEDYVYELIEWSLPLIKSLIEEAYIIYDFVEENISINEAGVSPIYKDEGYLLIPDNLNSVLQIHKYQSIIYSTQSTPYHSLKTSFLENSRLLDFSNSAEFLKHDLIKKYNEKPNLATFVCETGLDFPFDETIFPLAKRKLLTLLTE
ncbi:MAG: hypothetical protein ACYCVH_02620 [Ignavibacteriaceae bacterium]